MSIEKIITKAIEGGWKPHESYFLDADGHSRGESTPRVVGVSVEDGSDFDMDEDVVHLRFSEDEVGYENEDIAFALRNTWLDSSFWQSLGKAMEWQPKEIYYLEVNRDNGFRYGNWMAEWQYQMHRFIDHLAEGKTAESFFEPLQ